VPRDDKAPRDPREGGYLWNRFYKYLAGPAEVDNAVEGVTEQARQAWKRDLEARKRWSREQRERKRAARKDRPDA
jgi:hypothetical protein